MNYTSWGRTVKASHQILPVHWKDDSFSFPSGGQTLLPYGLGRSYGDSCLNDGGVLLDARPLSRFMAFDRVNGILRCESGVSLEEILELIVPAGWFLPVSPGTKQVTVGGAIANDVHGKNHHRAGTFGCHVRSLELLRSDGNRIECSAESYTDLFRATIGGLGLTGLILWAEFSLVKIASPMIEEERIRFGGLDEFFALSDASDEGFEHTVAWLDCLARGKAQGRGIFIRGNFARSMNKERAPRTAAKPIGVPFDLPGLALNNLTMGAFNKLYYYAQLGKTVRHVVALDPFFYPLDSITDWNRLYGKRGFYQYQFVIPYEGGTPAAIRDILTRTSRSGMASFLAVMKMFGDRGPAGFMSFPKKGVTLTLDIANRGKKTLDLLESFDSVVKAAGGRVYPAKDARMSPESFRNYFPQWSEFAKFIDRRFSSNFWRRVTS